MDSCGHVNLKPERDALVPRQDGPGSASRSDTLSTGSDTGKEQDVDCAESHTSAACPGQNPAELQCQLPRAATLLLQMTCCQGLLCSKESQGCNPQASARAGACCWENYSASFVHSSVHGACMSVKTKPTQNSHGMATSFL